MTTSTTDRFIVGTGRCGSTLLSRMLDEHLDVVCLHEFYTGLDWGRRFQPGDVTAAELADFLADEQMVTTEVLARGYTTDEICYPFGQPQAQRKMGDRLPWLLISMLSRLSDDPDPLFNAFIDKVKSLPTAPLSENYRHLFEWLAAVKNKPHWIERSGSSIDYLADLIRLFPEGRFLHIHRDGCEAALSMRAHPFYRLGVSLRYGLFPADLEESAMIDYVLETLPPAEAIGQYWSDQVLNGYKALGELNREQFCEVRFEDLVNNTRATLEKIADFFALPSDREFLQRASSLCRGEPPTRLQSLSVDEQTQLQKACRPGQILLKREQP